MDFIDKKKKTVTPTVPVVNPLTSGNLVALNVKTEIQRQTAVIKHPIDGQTIHQIILRNVLIFYKQGQTLVIKEVNNYQPTELTFINSNEAATAELRFKQIMNGAILL